MDQGYYYCSIRYLSIVFDKIKLNILNTTVAFTQISELSTPKTTQLSTTSKIVNYYKNINDTYVECDADENICWNGGQCYKTNPALLNNDDSSVKMLVKKFCM